jgi:hypothetical protein
VETQRIQYDKLERHGDDAVEPNNRLSAERLQKMQSIEFPWNAMGREVPVGSLAQTISLTVCDNSFHQQWDMFYERLFRYREENGVCTLSRVQTRWFSYGYESWLR